MLMRIKTCKNTREKILIVLVYAKTCKDSPSRIEYWHGSPPIHARAIYAYSVVVLGIVIVSLFKTYLS